MVADTLEGALSDTDEPTRIAIVNDDREEADIAQSEVEEAGYQPVIINGLFTTIDEIISAIVPAAEGVVCDHRLNYYGYANFNGAMLVAALYDRKIPSVLVTQFTMDIDSSIRLWRRKIPVLLKRTDANPLSIRQAMQACTAELRGDIAPARQAYPSLIRVEDVRGSGDEAIVDAVVLNWNPHQAVSFPLSLVPAELRERVGRDVHLLAEVNVGAETGADLFFENIKLAPEPDPDDGLA